MERPPTWILITIALVVLSAVAGAVMMVKLFKRRRARTIASTAYTKSLVDQGIIAQTLADKTKEVEGVLLEVNKASSKTQAEQQTTFEELAASKRELEDLQISLASAVNVNNANARRQNAEMLYDAANQGLEVAKQDLVFYNKAKKKVKEATATGIKTIASALETQNNALKEFRKKLQNDTVKLAQQVNNPSITPPVVGNKPNIRTVWDVAIYAVASEGTPDKTIKQLAEIYTVSNKDYNDLVKAAKELKNPTKCEQILRVNGVCPEGFTDTGRNLGDVDGTVQCIRGPCKLADNKCSFSPMLTNRCPTGFLPTGRPGSSKYACKIGVCKDIPDDTKTPPAPKPTPPPAPKPTPPPAPLPPANVPDKCMFKVRDDIGNGVYKCSPGWVDTGLDWANLFGDFQCMTPKCKNPNPDKVSKDINECIYIPRMEYPDKWACPYGFQDTGLNHEHVEGDIKQCKTAVCPNPDKVLKSNNNDGCPNGGWQTAQGSVFSSYPNPGSKEGKDFNGDFWAGKFAYIDGKQSPEWVASQNIVAVFNSRDGRNDKEMRAKYAGRDIWIKSNRGKCMKVKIVDTCGDSDCNGCCSENANKGGGMLIDLEKHTAQRFFGDNYREQDGEPANFEKIEWQFA